MLPSLCQRFAVFSFTCAVLATAQVGCFSPALPAINCGPDSECPTGQVCDDFTNRCRTPGPRDDAGVIDAFIGDEDNDGVVDALDNCPGVPNEEQYDEDSDEVGDVCDNCPATSNTDQLDQMDSGDGVGDACDPFPTTDGDVIALFEPFNGGFDPRLRIINDTFEVQDGRLLSDLGSLSLFGLTLPLADATIATRFTVQDVSPMSETGIGVFANYNGVTGDLCGHMASYVVDPPNARRGLFSNNLGDFTDLDVAATLPLMADDVVDIRFLVRGSGGSCTVDSSAFGSAQVTYNNALDFGLFSGNMSSAFDYLIVYARR